MARGRASDISRDGHDGAASDKSKRAAPIVRLFDRSKVQAIKLPKISALLAAFATKCAGGLRELLPFEGATELQDLDQGAIRERCPDIATAVAVSAVIAEWDGRAFVFLEPNFLFRMLDVMYGGDPSGTTRLPERPLTMLEKAFAEQLANVILRHLQVTLEEHSPITIRETRCEDKPDPSWMEADYISVRVRVREQGGSLVVALPAGGFRLLGERLSASDSQAKVHPDPAWAKELRQGLVASSLDITASMSGPTLSLSDISQLRPGVLLEFDGGAIENVKLEIGPAPIFLGRLGQSRGMFTIRVDRLWADNPETHKD